MKILTLFLCLLTSSLTWAKPTVVAVVDMGIAYHQVYSLKPYLHEPTRWQNGWDYSLNEPSIGVDYSFKYEQEFHGTFIAYLITRPYLVNTNRIKILDIVYNDYYGNLFELNRYMFPESLREVYYKKQAYEKFSSHVAKTFTYAEQAGAKVINFSSADRGFASEDLYSYLKEAGERGTFIVVSAGNDSSSLDNYPQYPCSYNLPNVVCVGAVSKNKKITPYSNFGKDIDLYALGNIATFEGTSFAAPLISRAIALIINSHPSWSVSQIRSELFKYTLRKNGILVFSHQKFHQIYR